MTNPFPSSQFRLEALPDFAPLREAFARTGYTAPALAGTIAIHNPGETMDLPLVLLRTEEPTDYHALVRLFVLAQAVAEDRARQALCPMPLEPLLDCNLLWRSAEGIRSIVKLVPYDRFYFVSDFSHRDRPEALPPDFVLGVGPASVSLASLTVRRPAQTAFDLGAGAGVQSILATSHCGRVIGTDTNPRALNFAAFNARLNAVDNIEWREGSFFAPVSAEQFDLAVANPPFVISPESSLLYRDGGGEGDAVSEHVVRGAARRLKEGGFASMLINWHHKNGDDWSERPLQWLAGNGCDGWLIRFTETDPLIYAANWLRQTESHDPSRYRKLLRQWTDYYRQSGIGRISGGAIILRKRAAGPNWIRHDSMQNIQATGSCGEHILRIFAAEDFLQTMGSDEHLFDARVQPHPDLAVEQKIHLHEGGWNIRELAVNLSRGFPFPGHADIHVLKLLTHTTARRTVREVIQCLAQETNSPADALAPTCLSVLKTLIRYGMVVPADS